MLHRIQCSTAMEHNDKRRAYDLIYQAREIGVGIDVDILHFVLERIMNDTEVGFTLEIHMMDEAL